MTGRRINIKDIALMAILTALMFGLEEAMSFLPNIQLTVFLIILYSKKLGTAKSSIIVLLHVILDNLFMSSFSLIYFPFMLIGWLIIPLTINEVFKKVNSSIGLAFLGIMYAFIYSWVYIIPTCLYTNIKILDYLIADILFELILALSSFLSILILYGPCSKVFDSINVYKEEKK